jgi:hypothetical protein
MEELKKKLAPIHKELNENLTKQQLLLEEYQNLLEKSIETTDDYFQKIKDSLNAKDLSERPQP